MDMAGLGKYCTGGYGRIGVYRVNYGRWEQVKFYPYMNVRWGREAERIKPC